MYVRGRVDNATILVHFKVHVGSGRATGIPRQGHYLALFDDISWFDQEFLIMGIQRFIAIAVVDLDHLPITLLFPGEGHYA